MSHSNQYQGMLLIDPRPSPPLTEDKREEARRRFLLIVDLFIADDDTTTEEYHRPKLIKYMYEYAPSQRSKDNVLESFFRAMDISAEGDDVDLDLSNPGLVSAMHDRMVEYADYLLDFFFIPLMGRGRRTPQPSPIFQAAALRSSSRDFVGSEGRIATLRGECLVRDKHRCVISRAFNAEFVSKRGRNAPVLDVDGTPITDQNFAWLEVAHIMPHSLFQIGLRERALTNSQHATIQILNMFDYNVAHEINRVDIDEPRNALTLSHHLHRGFDDFSVFFTAIDGPPHTYRVDTFSPQLYGRELPVTRTLFRNSNTDPPLPRLLALHRAIAHILHLSAAGDYINELFQRFEEERTVKADGSTPLGELLKLRLCQLVES